MNWQYLLPRIKLFYIVGLTTENVERRLVDRALLQQGLPREDDLYLVIRGHDLADDNGNGGGGQRREGGGLSFMTVKVETTH
jgi:hypothetical protein